MPIGSELFNKTYAQLNSAQKKAVDTIDGPVMVIAGPGTGKTQVLAARIATILLKTDTKPHNILALTFTDSAAKNMRERVVQMIGKTGYYVNITTFHAFCKDVIETHPEYFSLDRDAKALTQIERFDIFESIITALSLEILKPINAPFFYLQEMIKAISDLKKEGIDPHTLKDIVEEEWKTLNTEQEKISKAEKIRREKLIQKHQELILIYEAYQQKLDDLKRYDFDDMITLVRDAFHQHDELLLEYQETLHYFLVDEYQDTNTAQNSVVKQLASYWSENANIFVVGDPNQSIYRFQGASVENMLSFIDLYPHATVITLETGYRSTQSVYDAAHTLIQNNTLTTQNQKVEKLINNIQQKLTSVHPDGESVDIFVADTDIAEAISITDSIEQLVSSGVAPEEIAVIYRNNADVAQIQELLDKKQMRYEVVSGSNILETDEIQQLLTLLHVILALRNGADGAKLFEILTYEWMCIHRVAVLEIARFAGTNRLTLAGVLEKGYTHYTEHCETCLLTEEQWQHIEERLALLKGWGVEETHVNTSKWFSVVLEESGYLDWIKKQPDSLDLLVQVNTLFNQLKGQQLLDQQLKLENFLHNIDLMIEHGISIQTEDIHITEGAIKLTTAHSAKGQEWRYVFIIKCLDGKWGNSRKRELLPLPEGILQYTDLSKKEKNEDDRRLFYVALTRAKQKVQISYSRSAVDNGKAKELLGSMFIEEITTHLRNISLQKNIDILPATELYLDQVLRPTKRVVDDEYEKQFYSQIVNNFSLSITALNDYLRDTDIFIYKHILRVPEPRTETQAYGTAMHRALEFLYRQWHVHKRLVNINTLNEAFESALQSEAVFIDEYDRRLKRGKDHLTSYYASMKDELPAIVALEKTFGKGISKAYLDDISLVGRIDRIDWNNIKNKTVNVIDYKTGKSKTMNDIEGVTQTAQKDFSEREKNLPDSIKGPLKRQLLFYKLLGDLDTTFQPTIIQGVFDFVEPDKQTGKFVKRVFELDNTGVADLKQLIREVMREIRNLDFINK